MNIYVDEMPKTINGEDRYSAKYNEFYREYTFSSKPFMSLVYEHDTEVKLQTLQDLFLDINKKEPIVDTSGNIYGVKELTLNDVKKIILDKITELETSK